ncbi:MAG: hypothetical protein LBJ64_13420, partial [Deltaproteobacteria bacterium]|nr:hypothetical protein [Deltaproteobacteria bacterium]
LSDMPLIRNEEIAKTTLFLDEANFKKKPVSGTSNDVRERRPAVFSCRRRSLQAKQTHLS